MFKGALPGFRDFYPQELAERAYIMSRWREVARRYAFVEYDGPPLEPLDLYARKSGDEIVGQLYNFVDKGGREVDLGTSWTLFLRLDDNCGSSGGCCHSNGRGRGDAESLLERLNEFRYF